MRADYRSGRCRQFRNRCAAARPWHSFCRSRVLQLTLALTLPVRVFTCERIKPCASRRVNARKASQNCADNGRRVWFYTRAVSKRAKNRGTKVEKRREQTRLISAPAKRSAYSRCETGGARYRDRYPESIDTTIDTIRGVDDATRAARNFQRRSNESSSAAGRCRIESASATINR